MNDVASQIGVALRAISRYRWVTAGVAWVLALIFGAIVWFVPNRYEASAKIFVDTQTVLRPMLAGLAFQPDLDQQIKMLARTWLSRPNLELLLKDPLLAGEDVEGSAKELVIDKLTKKIKIDSTGGNLYSISFQDADPLRAKAVVGGLANLFMDSGIDNKQRDSQEASRFIDEQIKTYDVKLVASENRLKDFKLRNFGVSGVSNQDYFARTSALADEVNRLQLALNAAEQSRDALKRELSSEQPQLPAEIEATLPLAPTQAAQGPVVQLPSELDQRLDAQRRQLDDLLRRYTDEHPDVVSVRRTIGLIEQQRQAERDARVKAQAKAQALAQAQGQGQAAAPASSRNSGNNPVYQRIRIALAEGEANVASLRSQLSGSQARLEQTRALANRVPQAEAELAQLNRDYDIMRRQYEQLVSRREAASLGVKIDQSAHMAEFRIVEPPRAAPAPVFPDRLTLAALGAVLAVVLGIASAIGLSKLFPTIDSLDALGEIAKRPVLGAVSMHMTPGRLRQKRYDSFRFAGIMGGYAAANLAWLLSLSGASLR